MENTLTSKRDELSNRIAAAPVGQDVSSLLAARNWYNRAIEMTLDNAREIKCRLRPMPLSNEEWTELLAAERVLDAHGELVYAVYNED